MTIAPRVTHNQRFFFMKNLKKAGPRRRSGESELDLAKLNARHLPIRRSGRNVRNSSRHKNSLSL
jgi:hypothetical protein